MYGPALAVRPPELISPSPRYNAARRYTEGTSDGLSEGDGEEGGSPVRAARLCHQPPPLPRRRLPVLERRAGLALPGRDHGRALRQGGRRVAVGRGARRGG